MRYRFDDIYRLIHQLFFRFRLQIICVLSVDPFMAVIISFAGKGSSAAKINASTTIYKYYPFCNP